MTGAPLPSGSDAVVMVEKSRLEDSTVILPGPVARGQNRLIQGRELKAGEVLLPKRTLIDPTKLGLIASAGRAELLAIPRPTISIVPTGDELVPPGLKPAPGQIRNSNGVMLAALGRSWGAIDVVEHPIAPDDPARLTLALRAALDRSDVTIVCGGVSAGNRDLVPACLMELGVQPVFHKVDVKPGKPLWFGVDPGTDRLVFGLPGNPVSGVVSFLLFVKPALDALAGHFPKRTQLASFCLGESFTHRGDRPTFHPARLENGFVFPLDWAGSADLRTVALADGFASFPAGDRTFSVGEKVPFLPK
jgi:molybdopterin molybdotransferase